MSSKREDLVIQAIEAWLDDQSDDTYLHCQYGAPALTGFNAAKQDIRRIINLDISDLRDFIRSFE